MTDCRLAYAQARAQARHGRRLDEAAWLVLEATPDLAAYLQRARRTALAPRIRQLPATASAHDVERALRGAWRQEVAAASGWMPSACSAAVLWLSTFFDLECFVHLARGGAVRRWMRDDPELAPCALTDPARREEALAASPLGVLLPLEDSEEPPLLRWLQAWAGTWPTAAEQRRGLKALRRDWATWLEAPEPRAAPAVLSRDRRASLARRMTRHLRRHAGRTAAICAYLALVALDLERLRAGLVSRALFAVGPEAEQ